MIYEDFDTYVEVDPNSTIQVNGTTVTVEDMTGQEISGVYKDYGSGYFQDFTHQGQFTTGDAAADSNIAFHAFANSIEAVPATNQQLYINYSPNQIALIELAFGFNVDAMSASPSTTYYYTFSRSMSAGTATLQVYSDADRAQLLDTLTINLVNVESYRYFYAVQSWNIAQPAAISATISNITLALKSRAQRIFDAFNSALTGLSTTGANLYSSRQYAIPEDVDEAITTRIGSDLPAAGDNAYSNNKFMDKFLTLYARIHVKAGENNIDDQVLQIEREIWEALMSDTTLGLPYVKQIIPSGREDPEVDELSEKPAMMCDTAWRVHYRHSLTDIGK